MKKYLQFAVLVIVTLGFSISFQSLMAAWSTPTQDAPGGAYPMAVNVGTSTESMQSIFGNVSIGSSLNVSGVSSFAGNVGIGTVFPGAKLDVQGGQINASGGLCINGDCKASWPASSGGTITSIAAGSGLSGGTITTSGTISLNTANANTWTTAQTFSGGANFPGSGIWNASGNVGIGIASPGAKLDASGNIINSKPSQGWIGLTGDLPGYAVDTYPTLKTNASYLYFSAGGAYSGWWNSTDGIAAPKFTDFNDGGYYLDPNSTSRLNLLNANTLQLANGFQIQQGGGDYGQFSSWVHLNGYYGIYSMYNGAHIYPNNTTYGAWRIDGSRNGYGGINYNGTTVLMMQDDLIGLYNQYYGRWIMYGYGSNGNTYIGGGGTATIEGYVRGATYGFGGMYSISSCYGCRSANPFTGACSCPSGFTARWVQEFPENACGWYTGNMYYCYR